MIDKTIIDNFAQFDAENQSYIQALNFAQNLLENSLNEIAKANPYVTKDNTTILPAGAFYSNCILPSSSLDLLLVVNNSEIILNTHSLFKSKWSVFKNKLAFAWKNRKKKKKKRKKKQKGSDEATLNFIYHKDNYNILSLSKDLVKAISKHITINDIVHLQAGVLIVQGENVPYKIRIFPVLEKEELSFQFFQYTKTKLIGFSLKEHHNNLENLIENFGEKYLDQVKIFAGLYSHLIKQTINPIFAESLIANLPKNAFEYDNPYDNFVFAVNYLLNLKSNKLFSVANPSKKIYEDPLCGTTLLEINNFLKKLSLVL